MAISTAILTYHSQNVRGHAPADNDHSALREDLECLHAAGFRVVPVGRLLDGLEGEIPQQELDRTVCLTFDDGCDFDVRDLEFPGLGQQRSFLGIMQDFISRHGRQAQLRLHATSFVIASAGARRIIDERSLFGKGWISDDWWATCSTGGLMSIGNHGWDHNHPDLSTEDVNAGGFASIDTREQCEQQVLHAAGYIMEKSGAWPELFAYPFGESSRYIREEYFPNHQAKHRCRAALGTDPGLVTSKSDRWNLPRFVCGRDWRSSSQLLELFQTP